MPDYTLNYYLKTTKAQQDFTLMSADRGEYVFDALNKLILIHSISFILKSSRS